MMIVPNTWLLLLATAASSLTTINGFTVNPITPPPMAFSPYTTTTTTSTPLIASTSLSMSDDEDQVTSEVAADDDTEKPKKKKKKTPPPVEAVVIDISKLDMRVGVITKAWHHEEGDKLFCEEIDIGEETGPRQIASGLRAHYNLEDLEGQRVIVCANLKSRKLMGFPSHGMVLCAAQEEEDGGKVEFIEPPVDAKVGERILVEGFDGEPATENQIVKKKMLNVIFPDLSTDSNGVATYKGVALSTSAGPCVAQNQLPNVPVG